MDSFVSFRKGSVPHTGWRAQSSLASAFRVAARPLLSSTLPLGADVCPHPFLDELQGPLVLWDLEQLPGTPLIEAKAAHLSDHVPHDLGVCGEAPAAAGPRLANLLTPMSPRAPCWVPGPCGRSRRAVPAVDGFFIWKSDVYLLHRLKHLARRQW